MPKLSLNPKTDNSGESENEINPSAPDWNSAAKTIWYGSQYGTWDADNIKYNDIDYDITNFQQGNSYTVHTDYAYKVINHGGVVWGTYPPRIVHGDVYTALINNDNRQLFTESTYIGGYIPGDMWIKWGDYPNFESAIHPHVWRIRIAYEVMCDCLFPCVLDKGRDLILTAWTNTGAYNSMYPTGSSGCPVDEKRYSGVWTLTGGSIFNSVRAGGWIQRMKLSMYCGEGNWLDWATCWLNIDYIDIYYDYYKYKVDYRYDFDYSGYGLTTVDKFTTSIIMNLRIILFKM